MNVKEIKEMIILMNENNLSELEVEKGDAHKTKKARFQTPRMACQPLFSLKEKSLPGPAANSRNQR